MRHPITLSVLSAVLALAVVVLVARERATPIEGSPAPAPAASPAPAAPPPQFTLVHAEPFHVDRAFKHVWRRDQPLVNHGWLLVLAGDAELLAPRQTREPVLYVGNQTAERVNTGQPSGRFVVIVPGDFRLADAPIFLGPNALPEELTAADIAAALAAARAAGAVPPTAAAIEAATQPARTFASDYELRLRAIDLVEQHSPAEQDLIKGVRVQRLR
ncbi:MAG: hypothetical protein WAT39_25285 [Planctomycetota bacterium]